MRPLSKAGRTLWDAVFKSTTLQTPVAKSFCFRRARRSTKRPRCEMSPQDLADNAIWALRDASLVPNEGGVAREMQMMLVIWRIIQAETGNAEHPGKIGDYVGNTDFDVNIVCDDEGIGNRAITHFDVRARGKFHT